MSEVSIAELIGWRYHPGSKAWKAPGVHEFRFTHDPRRPPDMTADDLLTWLREREPWIEIRTAAYNDISVALGDVKQFYGDTLLAALEAAVRSLAGGS